MTTRSPGKRSLRCSPAGGGSCQRRPTEGMRARCSSPPPLPTSSRTWWASTTGGPAAGTGRTRTPPSISPLTVPQVVAKYDFPANSAAGQTIGIVSMEGGFDPADVAAYFDGFHGAWPRRRSCPGGERRDERRSGRFRDVAGHPAYPPASRRARPSSSTSSPRLGSAMRRPGSNLLNRLIVPTPGRLRRR